MKSSSFITGVVLGVILMLLAFFLFSMFSSTSDTAESQIQNEYNVPERPVFNVDADIVKRIQFESRVTATGRRNPEYIQILDGISEGDTVAVGGHYTLAHDARIRVRQ